MSVGIKGISLIMANAYTSKKDTLSEAAHQRGFAVTSETDFGINVSFSNSNIPSSKKKATNTSNYFYLLFPSFQ